MRRWIIATLLLPFAPLAHAEWTAGFDANESASYSFLTHYKRVARRPGKEMVWWQTASYLTYRARENQALIRISSPGLAAGGTHRWFRGATTTGLGGGYEVRWTQRRAEGATRRSTEHGPTVNGDFGYRFSPLTSTFVGARYSHANRWRYLAADLRRELAPFLRAGPQVVWQGNRDLTVTDVGGFVQLPYGDNALHIRAGKSRVRHSDGSTETRPYVSVGLATSFSF